MPDIYTNIFSIALFLSSLTGIAKYSSRRFNRLVFSLLAFLYILLWILYRAAYYFTGSGIDQATIVQLKFGLQGAAFGAYSGLIIAITAVLLVSIVGLVLFVLRNPLDRPGSLRKCFLAYFLMGLAFATNPAVINVYNLPVGTFIPSRASSDSAVAEFYKYYKKPSLKSNSLEHRNIVFIYAESLEQAFFNEDIFPGLVPRLKEIEKRSISFTNMYMAAGTRGTIWAISASECGLPLFLPNLAIMNKGTGDFLPAAICLGDLLKDEGYYLTYYGGASLGFTGKGNFFNTHGFADVFGKEKLIPLLDDPEYLNFWGLYDDSLFDISYKKFLELSESNTKFGLFLLTVDTHAPGYSSKSCDEHPYQDGKSRHLNSVYCSDYLISRFINNIVESPYAEKTIIVLTSDHLNWNDAPAADLLDKARNGKKNIFMIIDPANLKGREVKTRGTTFDIGTTLLSFLGYSGQIGLGRDLLQADEKTQKEQAYIQTRLYNWKSEILKFWGQPKIRRSVAVDVNKGVIFIDKKKFKVPIFVELNETMESALLFGFNGTCAQHLMKMDAKKRFLMVGGCRHIKILDNRISDNGTSLADDGWCLITGKGQEYIYKTKLTENVDYNLQEIKNILGMNDEPSFTGGKP